MPCSNDVKGNRFLTRYLAALRRPIHEGFGSKVDFDAHYGFVSRLQAKIASADLPKEIGTLSHPFASLEKGEDGKNHAGVTVLWHRREVASFADLCSLLHSL